MRITISFQLTDLSAQRLYGEVGCFFKRFALFFCESVRPGSCILFLRFYSRHRRLYRVSGKFLSNYFVVVRFGFGYFFLDEIGRLHVSVEMNRLDVDVHDNLLLGFRVRLTINFFDFSSGVGVHLGCRQAAMP